MTTTRVRLGLSALAVLAVMACGSDDSSGGSAGSAGSAGAGAAGGAGGSGGSGGSAGLSGASGSAGTGGGGSGGAAGSAGGGGGGGAAGSGASSGCVSQLALGSYHSCALKQNGTVWCWGGSQPSPVQVTALGNTVEEIAAGTFHSCARKSDASVWCWGSNPAGQLGDGSTDDSPTPVQAQTPSGASVVQISAGGFTSCARTQDGKLYCWGANESGQVGDNTTATPKPLPTEVTVLAAGGIDPSQVAEVIASGGVTCVRTMAGALSCWGNNTDGAVGDGTTSTPKLVPVPVATDVVQSTGKCARKQDGSLWCWGLNSSGQVGDGTTDNRSAPALVSVLGNAVGEAGNTFFRTCARKQDGTVWCWGRNNSGELGDGTLGGSPCPNGACKPSPVQVTGLSDVEVMASGLSHACAAKQDGSVWCWGQAHQGQLGDGTGSGQTCGQTQCQPAPVKALLACP